MRSLAALLALPASLLGVLAATQDSSLHWPYNLPRTEKYYPEHEQHIWRHAAMEERLANEAPAGMRKMNVDDGEKFRLEYWDFASGLGTSSEDWDLDADNRPFSNASVEFDTLKAAVGQHTDHNRSYFHQFPRNIFARAVQCPSDTKSCAAIGHPQVCCSIGDTCISTSSGVGCCPAGETCGQQVAGCDTGAGYTSCPNGKNKGCCIPGAKCEGSVCVFYGTRTVTTTLPTSTATTTHPSTVTAATTTSTHAVSVYTTTVTVTNTPSGFTTTRTVVVSATSTTNACSTGFFSCPDSLGGGCCRNGQACATDHKCPDVSSTTSMVTPSAPLLPTSSSGPTTTPPTSGCPVGYYMCSAYYLGDCCQVGRNCDTTSCPPMESTTVLSDGLTIVVSGTGAQSAASATMGSCATGWELCPAAVGGGCCPSGYLCGTSSCRATAAGQGNTAKMAPSGAHVVRLAWGFLVMGLVMGSLMIWL